MHRQVLSPLAIMKGRLSLSWKNVDIRRVTIVLDNVQTRGKAHGDGLFRHGCNIPLQCVVMLDAIFRFHARCHARLNFRTAAVQLQLEFRRAVCTVARLHCRNVVASRRPERGRGPSWYHYSI